MFINLFHGPQGAGKDTQASLLEKKDFIAAFSVGSILREVAKRREDINRYLLQGILVPPDKLVLILVEYLTAFVKDNDVEHIILTGFPRSLPQIKVLNTLLDELHISLGCVFYFNLSLDKAVDRIRNRYICPKCKKIYNLITDPPRHDTTCDYDGTKLVRRADDKDMDIIRERLKIFSKDTLPVIDYFRRLNCVYEIDASRSIDSIYKELESVFSNFKSFCKCQYK